MRGPNQKTSRLISACLAAVALTACGGNKVLKEPAPLEIAEPMTVAANADIEVALDWVIVRDGPGTWSRNADWDEYLVRMRNLSDHRIRVTDVVVFDSMNTALPTSGRRKDLIAASKATGKRYKAQGVRVKAGVGGVGLMAAGTAAYYAGFGLGYAALSGGVAATNTVAAASVGGIVLAPVLLGTGMVRGINNNKVAREIVRRQTEMPFDIGPGAKVDATFFFPLAPSPRRFEIIYSDRQGEHTISIDTTGVLGGLHIGNEHPYERQAEEGEQ